MIDLAWAAAWFATLLALGIVALPLVVHVFAALPNRGVPLARGVGWLIVSMAVWLLGLLGPLQFTTASVLAVAGVLGALSWWRWGAQAMEVLRAPRTWLAGELVFGASFLLAAWIRAHMPDIIGQEKFMDYAIMNSFLSHDVLPAPDPWLAGYGMPYYHLGYFMAAVITKLSGAPGPIAYNLAVVSIFALGVAGAFALVAGLLASLPTGRRWLTTLTGVVGGGFVMILGNLEAVLELLAIRNIGSTELWSAVGVKGLRAGQEAAGWLPSEGGWWWRASRIVPTTQPDGINEFPFFSFLLGDLHPHFMALPVDVLVVALGTAALLRPEVAESRAWRALSAVALGSLIPMNTWDVPVFWVLFTVLVMMGQWRAGRLLQGARLLAAVFGLGLLAIVPYFVGYGSQPLGLGIVDERTPLPSLLIIFGPFLLLTALWLAFPSADELAGQSPRWSMAVPLVAVGAGLVCSLLDARSLGLALALGGLCAHRVIVGMLGRSGNHAEQSAGLLLALGFTVIAGTELVFIRDSFGTRMNTVFKFHYNAWLLLALGTALALGGLLAAGGVRRAAGALAATLVVTGGLVYPVAASATRIGQHQGAPTLDGIAFARQRFPNDFAAIDWLRTSRQPRSVVVEAVGGDYTEFARVSTFGGIPTPIGWIGHELQWRGPNDLYTRRERLVQDLYQARDADAADRIMDALGATHVFVGQLERDRFGTGVGDRLKSWLPIAVQRGETLVLQRAGKAGR